MFVMVSSERIASKWEAMWVDERMNETSSDTGATPVRRQPFWVVGLALLGLVVVLLVVAFLMDRQLRPRAGLEAAPTELAAITTTTPAGGRSPFEQPTITPIANVAVFPIATARPSNMTVANSPLEREIEEAYYRYWDVLRQAYLNLDTSRLGEVMSEAELDRQVEQIGELKAQGKAAKLQVDHRIAFVRVSSDQAVIYDEYVNRSSFVDPVTKQELPTEAPPETEKISFEMKKIDNTWKVVDAAQHE